MPEICPRYARDMPKICLRYAWDMPKICLRYAQDMPEICPRYAQDMPEICPRYAQDMPKICPRYCEIFLKFHGWYEWLIDCVTDMDPGDASSSKTAPYIAMTNHYIGASDWQQEILAMFAHIQHFLIGVSARATHLVALSMKPADPQRLTIREYS